MCTLIDSPDERILRSVRDPFFPETEYERLKAGMLLSWRKQIGEASKKVLLYAESSSGVPTKQEIGNLMTIFSAFVSHDKFIPHIRIDVKNNIRDAWHRGVREENANYYAQKSANPPVQKDGINIQIVDGMSEAEAIASLQEQIFVAAGDFWDNQLQDSIRNEMESYLSGEVTRDSFIADLKAMVNKRLTDANRETLGDSYFDLLAHHMIVRTRSLSRYGRAKQLGASGYKLTNPMDTRTSAICRALVSKGKIYPLADAQGTVTGMLTGRSTAELKRTQPFLTSVAQIRDDVAYVPPITWGACRTGMAFQYSLN